ncbi:hypothetical protein LPJ53_005452 [Coemansia erecta]|uniref:Uncharacterized protein n=1 Tax=Coemansia erecta TaxID=147472 RepID=A0A9W8CPU4_9FUNG|nr:hypothetical protein LPJ53_005452 [Coemansia erecta]
MDLTFVPFYRSVFSRRESLEAQQQAEYEAKEADRLHRERVRELKYKKLTELPVWVPSRFRPRRDSERSHIDPPALQTTIRWADDSSAHT